jgi:transketolase
MGALLAHALSQSGAPCRIKSLGIPGEFGQSAYLAEQLYQKYGLTAEGMVQAAETLIKAG